MNAKQRLMTAALGLSLPLSARAIAQEQQPAAQQAQDANTDGGAAQAVADTALQTYKDTLEQKRVELSRDSYAFYLATDVTFLQGSSDTQSSDRRKYLFKEVLHVPEGASGPEAMDALIRMFSGNKDKNLDASAGQLETLQNLRDLAEFVEIQKSMGTDALVRDVLLPALLPNEAEKKDGKLDKKTEAMRRLFGLNEKSGRKAVLSRILQVATDVSGRRESSNPSRRTLDMLVDMGADLHQHGADGSNLAFAPLQRGNLAMVDMLHDMGLSLAERDKEGNATTSLVLKEPKALAHILGLGAPAEGRVNDKVPDTFLLAALKDNQRESARVLIAHHANTNARISGSQEPLVVEFVRTVTDDSFRLFNGLKLLLQGDGGGNRLELNTRANNGDDLYMTMLKKAGLGGGPDIGVSDCIGTLAFHGADPDTANPAEMAQLSDYRRDLDMGMKLRNFNSTSLLGQDEVPGDYLYKAISYSDNDKSVGPAIDRVLSNPAVAAWFHDADNARGTMLQATLGNPAAFEKLMSDYPEVVLQQKPDQRPFTDEMLAYYKQADLDGYDIRQLASMLEKVNGLGAQINLADWQKAAVKFNNEGDLTPTLEKIASQQQASDAAAREDSPAQPTAAAHAKDAFYNAVVTGDAAKIAQADSASLYNLYVIDNVPRTIGGATHLAAAYGQVESLRALKARNLSFEARNSMGETPVIEAVKNGQVDAFNYLADEKVNLGARTEGLGWALPAWAVDSTSLDMVKAVANNKVLAQVKKEDVLYAIFRAHEIGRDDMKDVLVSALARFQRDPEPAATTGRVR